MQLFATTGTDDLAQLRPGPILAWVRGEQTARRPPGLQEGLGRAGDRLANNSVRSRAAKPSAYLTWCARHGLVVADLTDDLAAIRRSDSSVTDTTVAMIVLIISLAMLHLRCDARCAPSGSQCSTRIPTV